MNSNNRIVPEGAESSSIVLVPEPSQERLNQRQQIDYQDHRRELVEWMLHLGKDEQTGKGYAFETARRRAHQLDRFYRFVWDEEDAYTTTITAGHLDAFTRSLAYQDCSESHKANAQKALKMYARWVGHDEWEPPVRFTGPTGRTSPSDHFTREERTQLREVVLEYGSVPAYDNLDHVEQREWERVLSQRYRKPIDEVDRETFDRANGFKIPSLVWTSLDAGLRPIEVGRATVDWVDTDNDVLRIPAEESTKNRDNWVVALQSRTTRMLERWITERKLYDLYDDSRSLWLTREGNPYSSNSLNHLLDRLCEAASIDTSSRNLSWYAIRHSTGTAMTDERDLEAAAEQLRHCSTETTRKYDSAPVEDRRKALNNIE